MQRFSVAIALAVGVFAAGSASASSVTYSFTNGNRSATALFQDNGGSLYVTLTNTSKRVITGTDSERTESLIGNIGRTIALEC